MRKCVILLFVLSYFTAITRSVLTPPAVSNITKAGTEDVPVAFSEADFTGSFADPDVGDGLVTVKIVSLPSDGTLQLGGTDITVAGTEIPAASLGTLTFVPNANYNGSTSFSWNGSDGAAYAASDATVTINLAPANDAPTVASPIGDVTVDEDAANTVIDLSGTFADIDDATLTVAVQNNDNTALVAATYNATTGQLTLDYTADQSGAAILTIRATDGGSLFVEDEFLVTVNAVNDAPAASDDAASVDEDGVLSGTSVLGNDSDPENDGLSATLVSDPLNGSLILNTDGTYTYTPNPDFNGTDEFTYTVSDGNGGSAQAKVTITVNAVNDTPAATNDAASVDEDGVLNGTTVLANDGDVDAGTTLTAVLVDSPANGTLTLNGDGTYTYTPNADFNGTDQFTYTAYDGTAQSNIATVAITVNAVNDAPTAVNDAAITNEDVAITINVLSNDSDPENDGLSVTAGTATNGSIVVNADNTITFTPAPNFSGSASFTYTVSDGNGGTATATVSVTVSAVNDAPIVSDVFKSGNEHGIVRFTAADFTNAFSDAEGDALTMVKITSLPSSGTLKLGVNYVKAGDSIPVSSLAGLTFTPNPNFGGTTSFGWNGSDGKTYATTPAVNPGANVVITITADNVSDPELIFNEFYVDPARNTQEFFELVNTSNQTVNVDCYSLVVYWDERGKVSGSTKRGFYVLDLPNISVGPGQYLVGAATNPFNFQGVVNQPASFDWNTFKNASGVPLTGGSLKKYTLKSDNTYSVVDTTLNDLFFENKDNTTGGIRYAMFLFNNGTYVNGLLGGHNSGLLTPQLLGMPALSFSTNCGTKTIQLSGLPASEHVTETSGKTDNGFVRKYDGICGEWEKSSSGGNNQTNTVEHTPGRTNGYSNQNPTGLTTSAQLNVCGNKIEIQISDAQFDYVFPVTVLVYEDFAVLGRLDNNDVYLTSIKIESASDIYHAINGYPDPTDASNIIPFDVTKDYLLVYRAAMGCLDRLIAPSFPDFTTAQKNFCGNIIDYSLSSGSGSDPASYLPVYVNIYVDLNGNGIADSTAGDVRVNTYPLQIDTFSTNIYQYTIPAGYDGYDNYVLVYTSGRQACITKTARAQRVAGSLETAEYLTCGSVAFGGDELVFDVTGMGDLTPQYDLPIKVTIYYEDTTNNYQGIGVLDGDDVLADSVFINAVSEAAIQDTTPLGLPVILVFTTNRGCAVKTVPLERGCGPLPVEFGTFTAVRERQHVALKWETFTEQNNKGFYVQRNTNGDWENRGFVPSTANGGNSTAPITYHYNDPNNEKGVSQYRIQQVDLDGRVSYSVIRLVKGNDQESRTIVYPNPSEDGTVNVVFAEQGAKQVTVSDISGRIVRQYRDVVNHLVIDKLNAGMYLIRITDLSTAETSTEKVIIKRR